MMRKVITGRIMGRTDFFHVNEVEILLNHGSEHYFSHVVALMHQSRLLLSFPFPQLALLNVVGMRL